MEVSAGGLDVNLNSQEVPYLFRVRPGCPLDLCCPMSRPERPRTFDGPGFVHMLPGRSANEGELEGLSEGQRIVRYLTELVDTLESLPTGVSGTSDETCEKLEELGQFCSATDSVGFDGKSVRVLLEGLTSQDVTNKYSSVFLTSFPTEVVRH